MSQAFCQQCGTRRDDDSAQTCANCGAAFATGQSTPIVPSDEAPTRIGNRPPSSPQSGANSPSGSGSDSAPTSGQQPWTPAAVQTPGNQTPGNQGPANQAAGNQGPDKTAQFPQQPYGGTQAGAPAGQGWQQGQPGYGQQGPNGPQGPGQQGPGQQWSPMPGQQPTKSGNTKLIVIIVVALVILVGAAITALVLSGVIGGDDDKGGNDKSSMSDEEQIEQVITDYNDGYQRLLGGDAGACDDLVKLIANVDDDDLDDCREEAGDQGTDSFETSVEFKSAEIDGDTATATVEVTSNYGGEPNSTETEMPMVKEDGDWKLDLDNDSSSSDPSASSDPSYGSEDPTYDSPTPSDDYSSYDPSASPSY